MMNDDALLDADAEAVRKGVTPTAAERTEGENVARRVLKAAARARFASGEYGVALTLVEIARGARQLPPR